MLAELAAVGTRCERTNPHARNAFGSGRFHVRPVRKGERSMAGLAAAVIVPADAERTGRAVAHLEAALLQPACLGRRRHTRREGGRAKVGVDDGTDKTAVVNHDAVSDEVVRAVDLDVVGISTPLGVIPSTRVTLNSPASSQFSRPRLCMARSFALSVFRLLLPSHTAKVCSGRRFHRNTLDDNRFRALVDRDVRHRIAE